MSKLILPSCLVCMFFVTLYLVLYPTMYWDSLMFRNNDGLMGIAVSVGCWVFFLGFVGGFTIIAQLIL